MIKLFEDYVEIKDLVFLTWWGNSSIDSAINNVYLHQDETHLYKDYYHSTQYNHSRPMTKEEKEKYIYNNMKEIAIYDQDKGFIQVYYDELIRIIKYNNLTDEEKELKRLKYYDKYKNVDPYGEEEWEDFE